ncbi:uncharacterized protein LOC133807445 isoform X2 [Humulus lupulus]|uniref:uncharacterized protein LOC133807445 isoform X2 n=1 Tax=Humulus lupulus TaxID=3486 RepID=UPI002B412E3E|nr:uncharacterized protein LOC133807445 isoform X2 [Humulus lupulus]
MGASSSTESVSIEQREAESIAASSGALPALHTTFCTLADPNSHSISLQSLQKCFSLTYKNPICEAPSIPDAFPDLLDHFGSAMIDLFFMPEKEGVSWVGFVKGYNKCSARMSSSMSLNNLLRVFSATARKAGLPLNLEFESDDADCKISGFLLPDDVLLFFWLCWTMVWDSRNLRSSKMKANLCLPDINHLVISALTSSEVGSNLNVWNCNLSGLDVQLPAGKFISWVLSTLSSLPDCFSQFVHARILSCVTQEQDDSESSLSSEVGETSTSNLCVSSLLSRGIAWAISLTMRNTISEELSRVCFLTNMEAEETDENLLYRSSLHGRGLNRLWSNVEGYQAPLLMLISSHLEGASESSNTEKKCIIGVLTHQGFENKDTFYGSSGSIYAVHPVFHAYSSTGKEKNFVYTHLHATGYEPHPKPVGIGFGGTAGNERIFIDEDFARITVRHHAVDKTYQHGFLLPDQGFLPFEAPISEVEVWGLGGGRIKERQNKLKKREELFTEQRRKIDLKTFTNWEDSPEKMMMDMMSNPNAVRREER